MCEYEWWRACRKEAEAEVFRHDNAIRNAMSFVFLVSKNLRCIIAFVFFLLLSILLSVLVVYARYRSPVYML